MWRNRDAGKSLAKDPRATENKTRQELRCVERTSPQRRKGRRVEAHSPEGLLFQVHMTHTVSPLGHQPHHLSDVDVHYYNDPFRFSNTTPCQVPTFTDLAKGICQVF